MVSEMLPVMVEFYTEGEGDETPAVGDSLADSEVGSFLSSAFTQAWGNVADGAPYGNGARYLEVL